MEVLEDSESETRVVAVDRACDDNVAQALCYAWQIRRLHEWTMATACCEGLTAVATDGFIVHFDTAKCGGGKNDPYAKAVAAIVRMFRLVKSHKEAMEMMGACDGAAPKDFCPFGQFTGLELALT